MPDLDSLRVAAAWMRGLLLVLIAGMPLQVQAQTVTDDETKVEEIDNGLVNPCAVVVRPGGSRSGSDLMVVEGPQGRVVGYSTANLTTPRVEVITSASDDGEVASCAVFRSRNRLLLGMANAEGTAANIAEFDIDDDALPMKPSQRKVLFTYKPDEGKVELADMARNVESVVVATAEHQWLLSGKLSSGPAEALKPFVRTLDKSKVGTPRAITFSDKGYLVVVEGGKVNESGNNSVLVFYHPSDSTTKPLLAVPLDLSDVRGLAYSPTTGSLYAAGAYAKVMRTGIFRLDSSIDPETKQQACKTVLVSELAQPTAMAFADDGSLFVTVVDLESDGPANGRLLKLTGDL